MDTLELSNANFVHRKMKNAHQKTPDDNTITQTESQSDVVYKVKTTGGDDGYIILLFEHQSRPEKMMAFRLLEYSVLLMRQHLDQENATLPVVMPVVFYHGRVSPYPYSTDIFDCFAAPELAKNYYFKPFKLIDVTTIPDEELKRNIITAPFQIVAKHIRDNDLLPVLQDLAAGGILAKNAQVSEGKLFCDVLYYAMSTGEISNRQAFETMLLEQTEAVRKPFMTILEQYQAEARQSKQQALQQGLQQGLQDGIQQGVQQGVQLMAKRLINKGLPLAEVQVLTELSLVELKALAESETETEKSH